MVPTIVFAVLTLLVGGGVLGATALPRLRRRREDRRHRSRTRSGG